MSSEKEPSEKKISVSEWVEQIDQLESVPWDRLPELDLYMDQVITLMNKQLSAMSVESDRTLTSSMINNYVKDGVMPRPVKKKYNREHLTVLLIICMLKSVFTMPQIRALVEQLSRFDSSEELYASFQRMQQISLHRAADRVRNADETDNMQRCLLAMELALEANANRIAAVRLLESAAIIREEKPKKEKSEKPKKEKDKE